MCIALDLNLKGQKKTNELILHFNIYLFRNEKETGVEMEPAIVSGIVTGDTSVSYWPIFSRPQKHSQKSLRSSFLLVFLSGERWMKIKVTLL